jgi:hypothetical protein
MPDVRDLEPRCGDAARKMAWEVTLMTMAGGAGRWAAFRLADGGTDRVIYDSRSDAVSHQLSPEYCTFVLIPPDGMTTGQADRVLDYWRQLHDAGFRDNDPRDDIPSMPLTGPDARRQIRLLTKR